MKRRPKLSGSHMYGPRGASTGSPEYENHESWCRYHGKYEPYDVYLASVRRGSTYGPPGSHSKSNAAARHRNWCRRNGWAPWEEYEAMRDPRGRESDATFRIPKEDILAKFRALGLVA